VSVITNCVRLAPMLSKYILNAGPPSTVMIPNASRLSKIQEVTIRGTVLRKQNSHWDPSALRLRISSGRSSDHYTLRNDGSLEFCIGVKPSQPHVNYVLLNDGSALLSSVNFPGTRITVSGFLRCSLGTSGLEAMGNARIFELNPIRSVEIDGEVQTFDLSCSEALVRDWTLALNEVDERRTVQYWKGIRRWKDCADRLWLGGVAVIEAEGAAEPLLPMNSALAFPLVGVRKD
jgi:hypothetical protein